MALTSVMIKLHVRIVSVHLIALVTLDITGMAPHVSVCLLSINDIYSFDLYYVLYVLFLKFLFYNVKLLQPF